MPPCPTIHEVEPKLTMEPPPAAAIPGATAWAAKNWCRRFTAKRSSQYSGVTASMAWRSSWAALLTSTRTAPQRASTCATAARRAAISRRSHGMKSGAGIPRPPRRAASASEASRRMSTKATRARCAHRCSTMEAPMPLPPPVTKTTRSSRLGYDAVRVMPGVASARGASPLLRDHDGPVLELARRHAGRRVAAALHHLRPAGHQILHLARPALLLRLHDALPFLALRMVDAT